MSFAACAAAAADCGAITGSVKVDPPCPTSSDMVSGSAEGQYAGNSALATEIRRRCPGWKIHDVASSGTDSE